MLLTGCSSSPHPGVPADAPRILVVGPGATVAAIADHLRGVLALDTAFTAPSVATLASENNGGYGASDTLMSCFYVDAGRADRLAPLAQQWSHIVLLEAEDYDLFAPEFFFEGVRAFAEVGSASGAMPFVLMRWGGTLPDTTEAHGALTYRVANGTGSVVAPAGYAWAAARAAMSPTPSAATFVAAATLYATITGRSAADLGYAPGGLDSTSAAQLAAIAYETTQTEPTTVHYTGDYHGVVAIAAAPAGDTMWFMASGSSSEQIWVDRMNDVLPRAGYAPQGTHIGFTNPEKIFDSAALTTAGPYFDANQYGVLLARTYSVDAATIQATGHQSDLQVQIWDRHVDGLPNDGIEAINMMDSRLNDTYAQATQQGLVLVPYHLMFAKLKLARPSIQLTTDGTHATGPVGYGLATMSVVARTGLSPDTSGLDNDTKLAAELAESTIRQLSSLSVSGVMVPDAP